MKAPSAGGTAVTLAASSNPNGAGDLAIDATSVYFVVEESIVKRTPK